MNLWQKRQNTTAISSPIQGRVVDQFQVHSSMLASAQTNQRYAYRKNERFQVPILVHLFIPKSTSLFTQPRRPFHASAPDWVLVNLRALSGAYDRTG